MMRVRRLSSRLRRVIMTKRGIRIAANGKKRVESTKKSILSADFFRIWKTIAYAAGIPSISARAVEISEATALLNRYAKKPPLNASANWLSVGTKKSVGGIAMAETSVLNAVITIQRTGKISRKTTR